MPRIVSLAMLICCLLISNLADAQTGLLRLRVVDENNLNLPGANVRLKASGARGVTDVNGNLILSAIAVGQETLEVTYIGYESTVKTVAISAGAQELIIMLKPRGAEMKNIVVMGDRLRGQARALNQQKTAGNIGNIISADQVGRFPDQNIGEALRRVPGITMQNDQGEARDIIIRGLAPQLNAVTLNGTRIPSAEGDNRRVQMDLIPADMIQTMEVSKTLTPDMDADAIGGSVNLVTRSAPNKLRLSGTLSGGRNQIRQGNMYNASILAGGRVFKNKLGVVAGFTIQDNDYGSDNVEGIWAKRTDGVVYMS